MQLSCSLEIPTPEVVDLLLSDPFLIFEIGVRQPQTTRNGLYRKNSNFKIRMRRGNMTVHASLVLPELTLRYQECVKGHGSLSLGYPNGTIIT